MRGLTQRLCRRCGDVYLTRSTKTWHCSFACYFWSNVIKEGVNDCWTANGEVMSSGYIRLFYHGMRQLAHRVSWEIHNGEIPDELFVLHRCDNPPCVNPRHLFLGTKQDNAEDRDRKGRFIVLHGSTNGRATLNENVVKEIKHGSLSSKSNASIGRMFGVTKEAIWKVRHGLSWRRVA